MVKLDTRAGHTVQWLRDRRDAVLATYRALDPGEPQSARMLSRSSEATSQGDELPEQLAGPRKPRVVQHPAGGPETTDQLRSRKILEESPARGMEPPARDLLGALEGCFRVEGVQGHGGGDG